MRRPLGGKCSESEKMRREDVNGKRRSPAGGERKESADSKDPALKQRDYKTECRRTGRSCNERQAKQADGLMMFFVSIKIERGESSSKTSAIDMIKKTSAS